MDQFSIFEALASSQIRRLTFQFVIVAASESDKGLIIVPLQLHWLLLNRLFLFTLFVGIL